ncbi:MAG: hypothetical protein JNK76_24620 [Planctomycetales bacterium]|nr:hypothetical protein [Planctomycetales bacterium]MBN8629163.1 hypothetical protein [Planctomycetota bacterium]
MTPDEFARGQRGREGPAWRYLTAGKLAQQTRSAGSSPYDRVLSEAVQYRRLIGQGDAGLARASAGYPLIVAAERLNEDRAKTAPLKLMALADISSAEMHARTGVEIAVLEAWEALFFDVRNQQKATCWLVRHVVEQERSTGDPRFASQLKLALMAGAVAVRGLLDHADGQCLDEADRLFQRKLILSTKFDAAVEMPIDSEKSRLAFIKFQLQLMEGEQRQKLAERRLAQRCVEASHRHELDKLKLAEAAERRALDGSARDRKAEQKAARAAAAQRRRQEVGERQRETASRERQAQAAASPLAQLTWAAKTSPQDDVNAAAPNRAAGPAADADVAANIAA